MSKYRAVRTGGKASKKEFRRGVELRTLVQAGIIKNLQEQVVFVLAPAVVILGRKRPPLRYIADYVYEQDGLYVVEDVKGRITEGYRIKRHLMKSVWNIDIKET